MYANKYFFGSAASSGRQCVVVCRGVEHRAVVW